LELKKVEDWCLARIYNRSVIDEDIKAELQIIKNKYAFKRKCRYISQDDISNIPQGEFKIVVTESNYIKKMGIDEYIGAYRGDNPLHVIKVDNTKDILLFTAQGKVFKLPVCKIPLADKGSSGVDLRILVKGFVSDIVSIMYLPQLEAISKLLVKNFIIVCTANNKIKKMDLDDFINTPPSGILYTKINDG